MTSYSSYYTIAVYIERKVTRTNAAKGSGTAGTDDRTRDGSKEYKRVDDAITFTEDLPESTDATNSISGLENGETLVAKDTDI